MFFLIDCNNFYASCEQVFQPELKNKALIVLSNNDGCVIARSKEAKDLGIQMGDPLFLHKDKKILQTRSSNFALYGDLSSRVMQTIETFEFPMQIYSIDECFLECDLPFSQLEDLAYQIKVRVKKWTGIDVSIGIAKTKTLAKLANTFAKKGSGVFLLEKDIEKVLEKTPTEKIWGIGSRLSKRLKTHGIISAKDLIDKDELEIRKLLGVNGLKTTLELKQIPCYTLYDDPEHKKSIACCRSFYDKESSFEKINQTISSFTQIATEKMRSQGLITDCICVMLSTSPFDSNYYSNSTTLLLEYQTDYTPDIISLAKWGIEKVYKPGLFYKRCGIILLDLKKKGAKQASLLFPDTNSKNKEKVIKVVDRINKKYDKNKIFFLAQGKLEKKPYSNKSPSFTTNWNEIPVIKI